MSRGNLWGDRQAGVKKKNKLFWGNGTIKPPLDRRPSHCEGKKGGLKRDPCPFPQVGNVERSRKKPTQHLSVCPLNSKKTGL